MNQNKEKLEEALRNALWRYGHHDEHCDGHVRNRARANEVLGEVVCRCGYEAVLEKIANLTKEAQ
jgi:hypothetical protein